MSGTVLFILSVIQTCLFSKIECDEAVTKQLRRCFDFAYSKKQTCYFIAWGYCQAPEVLQRLGKIFEMRV